MQNRKRKEQQFVLKFEVTKIVLLVLGLLSSFISFAQLKKQFSFDAMSEKIYVQTDSKAYTNESTIWFKAVVTDAIEFAATKLSGVLYVELIAPNERILEKKLIKLENGIGNGFFQLTKDYVEGNYLLRAYTSWNKNFGQSFFFQEYIQVFASTTASKLNPVQNVTITEGAENNRRITAEFKPLLIDPSHSKDLTVYLSLDDKKDTISLRRGSADIYKLDYPIPANAHFASFEIETKNNVNYSRSIILTKNYTDLQFFPESGEMLHGLPCVLGFKALDSIGKGKKITGEILNRKGELIASFTSNARGMGTVRLPMADSSEEYSARITTPAYEGAEKQIFWLPRAVAKGNMISVVQAGDKIHLRVSSNYLTEDTLFVHASCRGMLFYEMRGRLRNGVFEYALPSTSLPEGVIAFTVMNESLQTVAERLFFNERPETRLNVSVASNQATYSQREQTELKFHVTNPDSTNAVANLSVLVFNDPQLNKVQNSRETILSYLLLSSDLKGKVEDPGYYFGNDSEFERHSALDALLLTQGWRRYNYTRNEGNISYQPEANLVVSGTVTGGLFTAKQKKGTTLTMMSFGKPPFVDTQLTDSLGRFMFPINDLFQQTTNIVIQSTNKTGAKKDYTITLDPVISPPVEYNPAKTVEAPDSVVKAYAKTSIEHKKQLNDYIERTEGKMLDTVVVSTYAMTPERKKVADRFGIPRTVISGDDIRKNEAKWSYGLYSVLLFNYPDKIRIIRAADGTLYARCMNSEMTLVVIDGIPVSPWDYGLIPHIPPSEVKSVELIEFAKNFTGLYCDLFPTGCLGAPPTGNVISIFTYAQKGIFGANRAAGIMKAAIPVFATPREFYAPKYGEQKPTDWERPDLRSIVHWAPQVQTDSTGQAAISFYNSDVKGQTQVIVEAITAEGYIGYKRMSFEVIDRKKK